MNLDQCQEKLDAMRSLPVGWNGYTADPPNAAALGDAIMVCWAAERDGILPHRVEPSAMNGVGVTFRNRDREVMVETYNASKPHALFSDDRTENMETCAVLEQYPYPQFMARVREYLG